MKPWPHGVIVVPTVPTTASMYAPLNVPCGMTSDDAARPQSGWARTAETTYAADTRMPIPTKTYWTRLKLPRPISVMTAVAASSALNATGTPNSESAALMPANSETVEPRLAAIIVSAANAAQRTPKRSRIETRQALAGGEADAGADLLGDEERNLGCEQHPQEVIAELRPGERVRRDAARIVVGEAGDDARTEDRQDGRQSGPAGRTSGEPPGAAGPAWVASSGAP